MGRLVAVVARGGPRFVDQLRRIWDDGDTLVPLDPRLPVSARDALIAALRPTLVLDGDDVVQRDTAAPPTDDGDRLVVPTSGTTGQPKGVVLTADALLAHARAVHDRLAVDRDRDRWLACLPLAHIGGLGVVVRALLDDVPLVMHDGFDADDVARARTEGATLTSLVPTALDRVGAEGWRWVVLGGSSDPVTTRPANVMRTYGLTETGGGVVYGSRPLPGVEVRTDDGGQIWLRSPTLARGVRQRDGSVLDRRVDGWLATGDAGRLSPEGVLSVVGRVDDMIVTGGENVWPDPVERAIVSHPGVLEVAVAGRDDPEWGQVVVAWMVPVDPGAPPSLEAVRDHVSVSLPRHSAPRRLVLVDSLPRTALGKVAKTQLR